MAIIAFEILLSCCLCNIGVKLVPNKPQFNRGYTMGVSVSEDTLGQHKQRLRRKLTPTPDPRIHTGYANTCDLSPVEPVHASLLFGPGTHPRFQGKSPMKMSVIPYLHLELFQLRIHAKSVCLWRTIKLFHPVA